jgi:hypothetical protein
MKNNTGSKLTIKVSTCLEDNWLIKIQNIERRDFVFPRMKPQNKTTLDFSKMDKNKNVQNGFLRDYLFFLKKKIQKFPKFYFRCIIGKESTEFQKVFF